MKKYLALVVLSAMLFFPKQIFVSDVASEVSQPQIVHEQVIVNRDEVKPVAVKAKEKIELLPALVPICACESTGKKTGKPTQFNSDGTVKRGKINPNDIGICQINTEPRNGHLVQSKKLGFDVYTEEGNIKYANWLYKKQGSTPWNWSKKCWK